LFYPLPVPRYPAALSLISRLHIPHLSAPSLATADNKLSSRVTCAGCKDRSDQGTTTAAEGITGWSDLAARDDDLSCGQAVPPHGPTAISQLCI